MDASHLRKGPAASNPSLSLRQEDKGGDAGASDSIYLPESFGNKSKITGVSSLSPVETDDESDLEIEPDSPSPVAEAAPVTALD